MPDLDLAISTTSFRALRPVPDDGAWPPVSRPFEDDPQVAARLVTLGGELDRLSAEALLTLFQALNAPEVRETLRAVLVQLGAARLFQLIHWIADQDTPDASRLIASLMAGDAKNVVALRAAINAVTRRTALDRIFSPERIAAVGTASAVALKEAL